ncbi:MAG: hypothetical protein KAI74_05395, partial [Kiritimatiellae bacterium]|nr:hypothetical protein [Kiritimatiellia bacterium]
SIKVTDGKHRVRVVAYLIGNVRSQIYKEITVTVKNSRSLSGAEGVALSGAEGPVSLTRAFRLRSMTS